MENLCHNSPEPQGHIFRLLNIFTQLSKIQGEVMYNIIKLRKTTRIREAAASKFLALLQPITSAPLHAEMRQQICPSVSWK